MTSRRQHRRVQRGLLGVVAFTFALGCATLTPPLTPPERGGAAWSELTSTHFVLDTDLDQAEAREALSEFEGVFTSLKDVAFSAAAPPRTSIRVVLFRRQEDYWNVAPKNTAGYFTARLPNDVIPMPTMVMWGSLVNRTRLVFQHELSHLFVRSILGPVPRWLNEGLAQYYSTFELKDGAAILGKPLPDLGISTQGTLTWRAARVGPWERTLIPIGNVPPVAQIIGEGFDEIPALAHKARPTPDERKRGVAYYYGAWGLVHLLYSVPSYRARFNEVVSAVAQGMTAREAWNARFSDIDPEKLEADFREHLVRTEKIEAQAWTTKYTPPAPAPATMERQLSPADVHLLWARLRSWHDDAPRALARPDIEAARVLEPGSPEVQFWSCLFNLAEGRDKEAEADITRALEQRPNDARYLMAMVQVSDRVHGPAAVGRIRALMQQIGKVAVSAKVLDFVATYHADWRELDEGLRFAARAIKADPTCWRCYATLARLLYGKRALDEAVVAGERALNLLPDGIQNPELAEAVMRYAEERNHARREKAPPPATEKAAEP
jgi:tetratricopeptide (TPR) repeat protein